MNDLHWLGAMELGRAIAARKVSPVEVVQAHLSRITQLDGRLRGFLAVFADAALDAARSAEALTGKTPGLLHGVPIAVKDLYDVAGTPTTAGSRFLNTPAARDCTVVARLRAAGAIILGKLNLHEFAFGPEGTNPHHGTPWNPWSGQTQRIPGGSSSGSGVAVAAGLVPVGLGSDTGGSIRIPAACCGTVGLKPTYGRVSRAGIIPLSWSLDHAGPLTRTVEDAAAILSIIAGHDPADSSSSKRAVPDYLAALALPIKGSRVGLLRDYVDQSDADVQAAILTAAQQFRELGCTVEEVAFPKERFGAGASAAILSAEATAFHEPMIRRHAAAYAPDVRRRILAGYFLSAGDYLKGQRARRVLRDRLDILLQRVDVLLAPTLPIAAPLVAATEVKIGSRTESVRVAMTMLTRLFNVTGHPVISLPCGFSKDDLPLSLQLVGRAFEEGTILRLAQAYEKATDWHRRRPAGF